MDINILSERLNHTLSTLRYGEQPSELYEPIRYIMALGGKRIRPMLVLLSAKMFDDDIEKALLPAAGVEVFHNFTLMHDDIMDKAPLRRGQQTVHEKWNANIAILSGDVMLVRAYELMAKAEPDKLGRVLQLFSKTAAEVCEGQQLDMNFEQRTEVSIPEYIQMITLKTAVLVGFSLELGAILQGAPDTDAEHLKAFGDNIGIAFQLRDDLLDVYGDKDKFGKQVGGDILSDKKTFLMLTALEQANPEQLQTIVSWRDKTQETIAEAKVQAITKVYDQLNIRQQTEQQIDLYFKEALRHLDAIALPDERKATIRGLALQLMERDN
ncbi:polyprenyl synthetase family protein [Pontibacter sp. BT310]|uniref:Polyprenyl synthetase family protein n=1 Tax=Pontibacter populi TaxID=890055 RepID=A0ABS6X8Z6_9BACT|nr:polyprenyl synthetase family protein [Pontibacter populi]MBJ6117613.1 polyprenyl synthetase family protein [Pontibacter sp. BT310]MBR0570038.1 polyprenyl synthetase family protein [Microvirga sp. STS03]MBW3364465.1 polyprenyl synthetase family protein [Pontibacter populi]